jgi:DNA-binding transcriptional LysR family regulator
VKRLAQLASERWIAFPEVPGRPEVAAAHIFALFLTQGLGEVTWTAVDSLTAQKRLVEAGLGLALLAQSHVAEELGSGTVSTIAVGDLVARHDVTTVTRRGGFLSLAAQRLLKAIQDHYGPARRAGNGRPARRVTAGRPIA